MTPSEKLSIDRIKTWPDGYDQLHNDARKIVAMVERLKSEDPFDDPEYLAFYEECGAKCRCDSPMPCGGVLSGGVCDEIGA